MDHYNVPMYTLFCSLIFVVINVPPSRGSRMIDYTSDMKICQLRNEMKYEDIAAYIVIDGDDHQMKYCVHPKDKRREWLTNYNGPDGIAVVTQDKAAIWVPANFCREAEKSLSPDWKIIKSGLPNTISVTDWLIRELSPGDKVSTDSVVIDYVQALNWKEKLGAHNIIFSPLATSYIDMIWKEAPPYPKNPICILSNYITGKTTLEKVKEIRSDMMNLDADLYVITALDEISWILNMLGTDYPRLPLFRAYMLIGSDFASLYVSREKQSQEVERVLAVNHITLHDYDLFWYHLQSHAKQSKGILLPKAHSTFPGVSFEVYVTVPKHKIKWAISPALSRKDKKNYAEAEYIKKTHLHDAIRYVKLMMDIENSATKLFNSTTNEKEFVKKILKSTMTQMTEKQKNYNYQYIQKGTNDNSDVFIVNYHRSNDSSVPVPLLTMTSNCRHYVANTCLARTFLPVNGLQAPKKQTSIYTALLAGTIDLARSVFSSTTSVKASDFIVRSHLYKMGLNFDEEAIRGFGLILGSSEAFEETYSLNVFRTAIIGHVEANEWMMRLGNVMAVIPANTTYNARYGVMTFEMITLLPFERGLIDIKKLSNGQLLWLNRYHRLIRTKVGGELYKAKDFTTYEWLLKKTAYITRNTRQESNKVTNSTG